MSIANRLGPRFSNALMYAAEAHADQERKGSGIPYVTHVIAVAGLALEHGADEDVAIAALLHDVAEDQGGIERLARVSQRFGSRVASIVAECSDAFQEPKPEWLPRKHAHLLRLCNASHDARLVVAADKIHNARSIAADHRAVGEAVWKRFSASREQVLWYYRAVTDVLCARGGNRIFSELNLEVSRLERLGQKGEEEDWLSEVPEELIDLPDDPGRGTVYEATYVERYATKLQQEPARVDELKGAGFRWSSRRWFGRLEKLPADLPHPGDGPADEDHSDELEEIERERSL